MKDENPAVNVAASIIVVRLAEWIENSKCSQSSSEKSVDELLRDFGLKLI